MTDPFDFLSKGHHTGRSHHVRHVTSQKKEALLAAYRNNVAMPELHVADKLKEFEAKVLGEDGQEMTLERRRELMADKTPMVDEQGRVRGFDEEAEEIDYTEQFEDDIERERWGQSAEANRPGIRVIQPRELRIRLEDEALEKIDTDRIHIPMPSSEPVYYTSSVIGATTTEEFRLQFVQAKAVLLTAGYSKEDLVLHASEDALDACDHLFDHALNWRETQRAFGADIVIDSSLKNELRLTSKRAIPSHIYARVFIAEHLYNEYMQGVDTETITKQETTDAD